MESIFQSLHAASAAYDAGQWEKAQTLCQTVLHAEPDSIEALFLLGMIAHRTEQRQDAVQWLRRAAAIQPPSIRILSALGGAYHAIRDFSHAAECFALCLQLDPGCAPAYYQLGNACSHLRDREKACWLFRKAAELEPENHKAWNNWANCLRELGRVEESIAAFERALTLAPDCEQTRANYGVALLTAGRLTEGFREYEWRPTSRLRQYSQPVWKGEPIAGKTLFIFAEQGAGDTLQFIRYLPLARERGAQVVFECQPSLKNLLAASACADHIIACGDPPPPFDYFAPLLNLPSIFNTTLETIPCRMPYLRQPSPQSFPAVPKGHLKVGLAWAGNPDFPDNALRSLQLKELAPLLKISGVTFINLQVPIPPGDETYLSSQKNIISAATELKDFQDTAAAMGPLDLAVTVDTSVGHLAGALGKRVWMLLPDPADWRWLRHRTDSPWYPTLRLFRQTKPGHWQPPILELAAALEEEVLQAASTLR